MRYDDEGLERLLAGGNLSGAQYDRIEAQVMRRVAKPTPLRSIARAMPALALVAGMSAVALRLTSPESPSAEGASGFTAKGAGVESLHGAVELVCSGEPDRCRVEDTLLFVVDSDRASGYLNASVERIEPPSRDRVRLFPTKDGAAPHVEADRGTTVLAQGVRLASLPGPGLYRVDIWFSESHSASDEGRTRPGRRLQRMLRVLE